MAKLLLSAFLLTICLIIFSNIFFYALDLKNEKESLGRTEMFSYLIEKENKMLVNKK